MKPRHLALFAVAALTLTGCASSEPEAEPAPSPEAASSDHEICAHYAPTADGENPETAQSIIELYTSGEATPETVNPVFYTVKDLENATEDPALKEAVAAFNQPVYAMKDAMSSGQGSFNNQWNVMEAATAVIEACTDLGYSVD